MRNCNTPNINRWPQLLEQAPKQLGLVGHYNSRHFVNLSENHINEPPEEMDLYEEVENEKYNQIKQVMEGQIDSNQKRKKDNGSNGKDT